MKITLFDRNEAVCDALEAQFEGCPDVTVQQCDYEKLPRHDAVVAPGNSFGVMTGGLDHVMRDLHGVHVQDSIQDAILAYRAPVPPGHTVLAALPRETHGHLIYAPTMHAPQNAVPLDICYATIAAIMTAHEVGAASVAIPGLGTGAGALPPQKAARMMWAGYVATKVMLAALPDAE